MYYPFTANSTDRSIARTLKRVGNNDKQVASYLRGWNLVKKKDQK